ncbi:MAG: hypothetical protein AAGJ31_06960 [Verrucomicrobiota bacterium]
MSGVFWGSIALFADVREPGEEVFGRSLSVWMTTFSELSLHSEFSVALRLWVKLLLAVVRANGSEKRERG